MCFSKKCFPNLTNLVLFSIKKRIFNKQKLNKFIQLKKVSFIRLLFGINFSSRLLLLFQAIDLKNILLKNGLSSYKKKIEELKIMIFQKTFSNKREENVSINLSILNSLEKPIQLNGSNFFQLYLKNLIKKESFTGKKKLIFFILNSILRKKINFLDFFFFTSVLFCFSLKKLKPFSISFFFEKIFTKINLLFYDMKKYRELIKKILFDFLKITFRRMSLTLKICLSNIGKVFFSNFQEFHTKNLVENRFSVVFFKEEKLKENQIMFSQFFPFFFWKKIDLENIRKVRKKTQIPFSISYKNTFLKSSHLEEFLEREKINNPFFSGKVDRKQEKRIFFNEKMRKFTKFLFKNLEIWIKKRNFQGKSSPLYSFFGGLKKGNFLIIFPIFYRFIERLKVINLFFLKISFFLLFEEKFFQGAFLWIIKPSRFYLDFIFSKILSEKFFRDETSKFFAKKFHENFFDQTKLILFFKNIKLNKETGFYKKTKPWNQAGFSLSLIKNRTKKQNLKFLLNESFFFQRNISGQSRNIFFFYLKLSRWKFLREFFERILT